MRIVRIGADCVRQTRWGGMDPNYPYGIMRGADDKVCPFYKEVSELFALKDRRAEAVKTDIVDQTRSGDPFE